MTKDYLDVSVGSRVDTWEVLEIYDKKTKTRFVKMCRCRCFICGKEKNLEYHVLRKHKSTVCSKCYNSLIAEQIKKYWNEELNKKPFNLNLNSVKSYWFNCPNGHIFKSSIRDFSLDNCVFCKSKKKERLSDEYLLFMGKYFKFFISQSEFVLSKGLVNYVYLKKFKSYIIIEESDLKQNFKSYLGSENKFLDYLQELRNLQHSAKLEDKQIFYLKLNNLTSINLSRFESILKSIFNL